MLRANSAIPKLRASNLNQIKSCLEGPGVHEMERSETAVVAPWRLTTLESSLDLGSLGMMPLA